MTRCQRANPACAALALLAGSALSLRAQAQATEPFPAVFELSSLLPENGGDGSNGVVLNGIDRFDRSGRSVSSAGDINGDGVDDLLIGAYGGDPNGNGYAGESYVVFGGAGVGSSGVIELSALNGSNGFVLNGIDAGDRSGWSVSSAGDVNADGVDDLLIGAYDASPNGVDRAGQSYVVFGAADLGVGGVGTFGSFSLSALDGTNGFVLNGIDTKDRSGFSVSSAGDVNGDGIDDLIIGASGGDPNGISQAGESYLVFGGPGLGASGSFELSSLNGANGIVFNGLDESDYSGISVSSAGDVNGDGIDDLIIGAVHADPNGVDQAGESYIVFGAADLGTNGTGGSFNMSALNGDNGFVLNGVDARDYSGRSVSSAGDVNGDGFDDLLIGAHWADPYGFSIAGESYVVFGAADLGVGGVGTSGSFNLSALDGTNGFVLNGIDAKDYSGTSVFSAGDVNGDGIDDFMVGARDAGIIATGQTYLIFGATDLGVGGVGTGGSFTLSALNGTNGFSLNGIDLYDGSGISVSSAGDLNGDGIDDLVIGAYLADRNGSSDTGETYVVFGRNLAPCAADLNRDGVADQGDIQTFIPLFLAQDLAADFNADGILDLGDIQAFIASFLEGC